MGGGWRRDVVRSLEAEGAQVEAGEEVLAGAEQNGAHHKVHFVDKPGLKVLADRVDAAAEPDVLALRRGFGLAEALVNALRHGVKRRAERAAAEQSEPSIGSGAQSAYFA